MRNKLFSIFRFLITIGLLFVIFYKFIDYQILIDSIKDIDILYFVLAMIIFVIATFFSSIRWQILIKNQNYNVPLYCLFKEYLTGLFFNNFLPTSIGGDVSRVIGLNSYLRKDKDDKTFLKFSFSSVFIERVFGFSVLIIVANIGILFLEFTSFPYLKLMSFFLLILCSLSIFFLSNGKLNNITKKLFLKTPLLPHILKEKSSEIFDTFRIYTNNKSNLLLVFLASVVFRLVEGYFIFLVVQSLHLDTDYNLNYLVIIVLSAMINVLRLFPSVNGLGISEVSWISFLAIFGIPAAKATLLSLLIYTASLLVSLSGGIFYLIKKR